MTELDTVFRQLAVDLLADFGKDVTILVPNVQAYDPDTNSVIEAGCVEHSVKMVLDRYMHGYVPQDIAEKMTTMAIIQDQSLGFTPKLNLEIRFDNTQYQIQWMNPLYSGEQIAAHILGLVQHGESGTV